MIPEDKKTFLGFDLSTQKLKAVQLSATLDVLAQAEVKFDSDLPEFRTTGGVNCGQAKQEFYAHPHMWIKAIDLVLDRLVVQGADLNTVVALSGSAQQHGSLYWSSQGIRALEALDADRFLHNQIDDSAFTVSRTPIWMDGTTTKQCIEMEEAIGGREVMEERTGSRCYERFTGPQIRKIFQQRHGDVYDQTERISLVSSFLASIFLGKVAPIDFSDASGMNLFDIREKKWAESCLNACAPDLAEKLGEPVPTHSIIGTIAPFFVSRFNFNSDCRIVAFTGDNPSAFAGMLIGLDWLAVSLGTSDTIMMTLDEPPMLQDGHVLVHPTVPEKYMGLLCFRNGSLVRDIFKRSEANDNWEQFGELLEATPRGNHGCMALHFVNQEIIPSCKGSLRWAQNNSIAAPDGVVKFGSGEREIRALVEGQMLNRKAVATDMGFSFGENTRILATGGASVNKSILQVMADVFNAPVYVQKSSEAALFGGAFRAAFAIHHLKDKSMEPDKYPSYMQELLPHHMQRICDPSPDSEAIYGKMIQRYREMVAVLMRNQ